MLRSGQRYPEDFRAKVLEAVDQGGKVRDVAKLFGVSITYVEQALARRRIDGISTTLPPRARKLAAHHDALRAHIATHPDITITGLVAWMHRERGVAVAANTMAAELRRLRIKVKSKRWFRPASGT